MQPSLKVTCFLLLGQSLHLLLDIIQRPQPFPVPPVSSLYSDPEDLGEELLGGRAQADQGLQSPPLGEVSPKNMYSITSHLIATETHYHISST